MGWRTCLLSNMMKSCKEWRALLLFTTMTCCCWSQWEKRKMMTLIPIIGTVLQAKPNNDHECTSKEVALSMLWESKTHFNNVLGDVYLSYMNTFKLFEHIGLEIDLLAIMMLIYDGKNVVMKGVTHDACEYLIKQVWIKALKNIWQHVIKKKRKKKRYFKTQGWVFHLGWLIQAMGDQRMVRTTRRWIPFRFDK